MLMSYIARMPLMAKADFLFLDRIAVDISETLAAEAFEPIHTRRVMR